MKCWTYSARTMAACLLGVACPLPAHASDAPSVEKVISEIISKDAEVDTYQLGKSLHEDQLRDRMKWYGPSYSEDEATFGADYHTSASIYGISEMRITWAFGQRDEETGRNDGFRQALDLDFRDGHCPGNTAIIAAIGGTYSDGPAGPSGEAPRDPTARLRFIAVPRPDRRKVFVSLSAHGGSSCHLTITRSGTLEGQRTN